MVTRYERYYTDIDEKVNEIKEAFYEQKSSAFGHLILKWIFELTDDEVNELITDGYDDNGIDAVYFDDSSSEKVVHFFQFKFPSSTKTMNNGITDMEVLTLFNGFNCFVGSDEDFNKLKWNDMLIEKRNEYKEKEIYNYKIWLIRFTTQELSEKYANLLKGECNLYNSRTGNDLSYETIFVKEAILMYEKNIKKIWPSFKIPYKKTLSPFTDEFSTINSVFIPIKSIYESIEPIEESVYEGNVRYLNPDSNINAGIVETLEKTPRSFHLLNNGITIVCEQCKDNATNQYLDIKKGSIINGAQTVGTIINYLKPLMPDEREKFSDSFVFAKIVEFNSPNSLVDKMVYTLNTQNTMKNSYTISNDPIVQTVKEKINNNTKYFLEVKPNEFLFEKEKNCSFNKMAKNKIDIETFIQSFVSFYDINKMASLSKNNKALLFRKENINKIITELKYDEALFSYEVYLKLMDIIKDYRAYRKNIEKKDVIGILGIKEYEIDTYRFLNTGNYLIMYALGYEYVKYEIEPISNIVTMIKKISNLFNDEKNVANATKIRETFDKVKNMIDREKSKSNLHR